jgi:hypothetical protein
MMYITLHHHKQAQRPADADAGARVGHRQSSPSQLASADGTRYDPAKVVRRASVSPPEVPVGMHDDDMPDGLTGARLIDRAAGWSDT